MKVFKFSKKTQTKLFTGLTLVAVIFSILIFSSIDRLIINQGVALLIVSVFSFVSLLLSIRKASKIFEEIIIHEENIRFYFVNKAKKNLEMKRSEIKVIVHKDIIEIVDLSTNQLIGKAYQNKIEDPDLWERLRMDLLFNEIKN